ncbi:MAG: tRNA (adenosine(37)-N6)-threonylcarbamoyltransferase complex transferase subunit TsaD [Oscillospiraceae bacterium]|nr:tRNA (adenosine(37)-N6)-threonylcarbamoyltransferase complex transferase subunit TsaD [Oscillospiraceae bacterium]
MKILAVETSCDETAAAVVRDGRHMLSNVVASQVEEHKLYGGVVPEIASRRHAEIISDVVRQALSDANTPVSDIDALAVTHAPGLIGSLLVGVNFQKGLALSTGLPLIPVHHLRSHIAANYLVTKPEQPLLTPPFLCLVVSGGHSHIVNVRDYTSFAVLGRTRDDAVGECYDKVARTMGMPYPGGYHLDSHAASGNADAFKLPRPHVEGSLYDFSFSGLKTAVINLIHNASQKGESINYNDLSASFQQTAVNMLVENTLRAAKDIKAKTIALAGGVSANSALRSRMVQECRRLGINLYFPPIELCGDNAAMVGAQAYYEFQNGNISGLNLNAYATMEID